METDKQLEELQGSIISAGAAAVKVLEGSLKVPIPADRVQTSATLVRAAMVVLKVKQITGQNGIRNNLNVCRMVTRNPEERAAYIASTQPRLMPRLLDRPKTTQKQLPKPKR